jgi:hypothetical protein
MAIYGGVREGWAYASGPRYNETLFRGLATFSSAATIVVTVPLPARLVTHAVATIKSTTAPTDGAFVTVGNYTGNAFTIYAWQGGVGGTVPAAAAITIGTSPYTYTSGTSGPAATNGEMISIGANGATATATITRTSGTQTTGIRTITALAENEFVLMKGDTLLLTYTAATPTFQSFPFLSGTTPVAYSNSMTVEWVAWANCAGVAGSY